MKKCTYGSKSLRNLCSERWHEVPTNHPHLGLIRTLGLVSYNSHIFGYGAGPIEEKGMSSEISKFIRGHCAASMRLRGMSITAYEYIAGSNNYPAWASIYTPLFISLTAAISSIDSLSCVLWALLYKEVRVHHPDLRKLRKEMDRRGHPMAPSIASLADALWLKELTRARNELVHRGAWPSFNKDGCFTFSTRTGLFSAELGPVKLDKDGDGGDGEFTLVDLTKSMVGLLNELEKWESEIAHELKNHAAFQSFEDGPLFVTACINEGNLLNDSFMNEQFWRRPSR